MNLRSPEAFWLLKNGLMNNYPSLKEDAECDVVVIGAGVTGALISHALIEAGYDTIVIDKGDVGSGSTSATTSMLQYEIDTPLTELAELIGMECASKCYRAGQDAINALGQLVADEALDCGFELKQSLQVAHSKEAEVSLRREYDLRQSQCFDVEWLTPTQIDERYQMKSYSGILSKCGASVDAYRLTHQLFQRNRGRGLRVYDKTNIKEIKYGAPVLITTEDMHQVTCQYVVFCTGYETLEMLGRNYAELVSTFACVSEQEINLYDTLKDVLIWDTNDPYIYMRTTDDGRLLVGGEDAHYNNALIRETVKRMKTKKLREKLDALFPTLSFKQDHSWAGTFGVTKDGLPYIGVHPEYKNAIFVMGLGGNGITFSVQGMQLVLKILSGEDDQLLHCYRFNR